MAWKYSWEGGIGRRIKSKKQGFWDKKAQQPWDWKVQRYNYEFFACLVSEHITALIYSQGKKSFRKWQLLAVMPSSLWTHICTNCPIWSTSRKLLSFAAGGRVCSVIIKSVNAKPGRGAHKKREQVSATKLCRNSAISVTFTCVCIWVL